MVSTEHNHKRKETWQGWMLSHNSGEVDRRGRIATLSETEEGGHKAI